MSHPRRNDPCPCGSGKKYKQCCNVKDQVEQAKAQQAMEDMRIELGGLRPAEAMVRFARPLLSLAQNEASLKTFMNLAQVCWNLSLMPPSERQQALETAVDGLKLDPQGSALQRTMLEMMIERHEQLFPLMHRTRDSAEYALTVEEEIDRLLAWGWEYLNGEIDLEKSEQYFEKTLVLNPELLEVYGGLAEVARLRNDYKRAEQHHKTALQKAIKNLGTDDPTAHDWANKVQTQTYLSIRHSLGLLYEELERYDEAIAEYQSVLERDKIDTLGVSYRLAPAYQLKGDLAGAMQAYAEYEKNFSDDTENVFYEFNWGLALFASGQKREAIRKLRRAFFLHREIAPILLDISVDNENLDERASSPFLEMAWEYENQYAQLWDETTGALDFLHRLWQDSEIQADLKTVLELENKINAPDVFNDQAAWEALDAQQQEIEEREPSEELLQRILTKALS
jgi:tetratricopeptide (TPR) repeat protein